MYLSEHDVTALWGDGRDGARLANYATEQEQQ